MCEDSGTRVVRVSPVSSGRERGEVQLELVISSIMYARFHFFCRILHDDVSETIPWPFPSGLCEFDFGINLPCPLLRQLFTAIEDARVTRRSLPIPYFAVNHLLISSRTSIKKEFVARAITGTYAESYVDRTSLKSMVTPTSRAPPPSVWTGRSEAILLRLLKLLGYLQEKKEAQPKLFPASISHLRILPESLLFYTIRACLRPLSYNLRLQRLYLVPDSRKTSKGRSNHISGIDPGSEISLAADPAATENPASYAPELLRNAAPNIYFSIRTQGL